MSEKFLPVTTKWLLDSVGETGRSAIASVYMLVCPKTQSKGTAFLLKTGMMISNWHVVKDTDAKDLIGLSSNGSQIHFSKMIVDQNRDLVVLEPRETVSGGLSIQKEDDVQVGTQVATWGFPLGYDGPAPLLSIGYLSGFNDSPPYEETASVVKHLVVNGAFNPGNSGGPLMVTGGEKVIGVVVSKHAPMTNFVASAIKALSEARSGLTFNYTDESGNKQMMVEAQVVPEVLQYFRSLTQVMIGEAIAASELIDFLETEGIAYQE